MQNETQKRAHENASARFPGLEASLEQLEAERAAIYEAMRRKILKVGTHYGTPIGDKPSLLKPGAEVLARIFQLIVDDNLIQEQDLGSGHRNFTVRVHIFLNDKKVGFGVGSCATTETKYRRKKNQDQTCPECGKAALMISKRIEGTYYCNPAKGGCREVYDFSDERVKDSGEASYVSTNPGDNYNTCLKMAKKRAFVDGVLTCTAASEIFTQDLEDFKDVFGGSENQNSNPGNDRATTYADPVPQRPAPGIRGNARNEVQGRPAERPTGPRSGLVQLAPGERIPGHYFDARTQFGPEEFQLLIGGDAFYPEKKGKGHFIVAQKTKGRFAGSGREAS